MGIGRICEDEDEELVEPGDKAGTTSEKSGRRKKVVRYAAVSSILQSQN